MNISLQSWSAQYATTSKGNAQTSGNQFERISESGERTTTDHVGVAVGGGARYSHINDRAIADDAL